MLENAFKAEGVKINWRVINSGAIQGQAMASGDLDFSAVMNTASVLMAAGAGNSIRIASGVGHPQKIFAIIGKPGTDYSIKDLKGKKVVGPKGTVLHQLLVAELNHLAADGKYLWGALNGLNHFSHIVEVRLRVIVEQNHIGSRRRLKAHIHRA